MHQLFGRLEHVTLCAGWLDHPYIPCHPYRIEPQNCSDCSYRKEIADLNKDRFHSSAHLSLALNPTHTNMHIGEHLERDTSSGTVVQETSFWLNLENALNKILSNRNSPDVELTLEVLKSGKRFHVTVSFDSDTGEELFRMWWAPNKVYGAFLYCTVEFVN